ncbi:MAG: hypothetical protein C0490_01210 [Marivirga sp.]|nr:hypothetical protein [Marivirga sp.]
MTGTISGIIIEELKIHKLCSKTSTKNCILIYGMEANVDKPFKLDIVWKAHPVTVVPVLENMRSFDPVFEAQVPIFTTHTHHIYNFHRLF